jgi:hypothetical protein
MVPRTVADLFPFDEANRIMLEMPPPSTTVPPTTVAAVATTVPATTTPSTTPPEEEEEPSDDGGIPWGPVAVLLGAIGGALLWIRSRNEEEDDCTPLLRVWEEEKERTARIRERLEAAGEYLNDRLLRVSSLETLLAEYTQASEGPRGGSGGLDMVRLEGQMIGYDGLMEMIAEVAQQLNDAQEEAGRALDEFNEREASYNEQVEAETAAREAYEACIGAKVAAAAEAAGAAAATAASAPKPAPSGAGLSTSSSPGPASISRPVSSEPSQNTGCDKDGPQEPVLVPLGAAGRFRLYRDFDVISTVDEASAHGAHEHGAEMATGLRQAGLALSTLGAVLSGGGAAGSGVSAARGFQSGTLVKGSLAAVKGTVSGLDATSVIPPVPTSLPEAIVVGLAATANLGALIAGKVTEWMGDNNLIQIRVTYYYQEVSIQPTQIWECEGGIWRCRTVVNVYTVGGTQAQRAKAKPFTVKGDADKRALRNHISRLSARGRSYILNSAKAIAKWESEHPPGDCI